MGKKKWKQTAHKSDPTSITPSQRVSEYPGEHLVESNRKLFCKTCRETLAVKSSIVRNHVKSEKHADSRKGSSRKRPEKGTLLKLFVHMMMRHTKRAKLYRKSKESTV